MGLFDIFKKKTPQADLPPWERNGYEQISSYAANDIEDGDRQILEQLRAHGADLKNPRHIIHYFYFENEAARSRAEQKLVSAKYETRYGIGDTRPGAELPLSLIAERTGIVDETTVAAERALLTRIAEDEDGDYDGWEASLD